MKHNFSLDGFNYRLRPVRISDAQFIIDVRLEDAERNKYIHKISRDIKLQEDWINSYFERPGDYYFVVDNRITGESEGLISIYDEKDGKAEWGRWVLKRNSLAAAESVDLMYRIAFEKIGLVELYCRTVQINKEVVSFHDSIGEKTRCIIQNAFNIDGNDYNAVEQYADKIVFYKEIHPLLEKQASMIFKRNMRIVLGKFEFHHIGVAVKDINKELATFAFLGYSKSSELFEDYNQGIRGIFIEAKGQPRLELIENQEGSNTVTQMIENGNKMYHFGYLVNDIDKAIRVFVNSKARVISQKKQSMYFTRNICFLMLPNMYIIELIEE